mmetsp:Transcript_71065/g.148189  ORF Transcript_71065/g.148189 Transcript_71065/m.148189 type:complete len:222 (-) Transcript_71065:14-679(-)
MGDADASGEPEDGEAHGKLQRCHQPLVLARLKLPPPKHDGDECDGPARIEHALQQLVHHASLQQPFIEEHEEEDNPDGCEDHAAYPGDLALRRRRGVGERAHGGGGGAGSEGGGGGGEIPINQGVGSTAALRIEVTAPAEGGEGEGPEEEERAHGVAQQPGDEQRLEGAPQRVFHRRCNERGDGDARHRDEEEGSYQYAHLMEGDQRVGARRSGYMAPQLM